MLASLQTLLFSDRDKAPTASEVTYNYVLECAVIELQNRDRAQRGQDVDASGLDSIDTSEGPAADPAVGGDTEKHKIKEQQRRAKKRQLLTQLQTLVMGDSDVAPKAAAITARRGMNAAVVVLMFDHDYVDVQRGLAPCGAGRMPRVPHLVSRRRKRRRRRRPRLKGWGRRQLPSSAL